MTDFKRRALLGDKDEQELCTDLGISLICPFCGLELIQAEEGWLEHPKFDCILEGLSINTKKRLKDWNTRIILPIGKCEECKRWQRCNEVVDGKLSDKGWCCRESDVYIRTTQNSYCNEFEQKKGE